MTKEDEWKVIAAGFAFLFFLLRLWMIPMDCFRWTELLHQGNESPIRESTVYRA